MPHSLPPPQGRDRFNREVHRELVAGHNRNSSISPPGRRQQVFSSTMGRTVVPPPLPPYSQTRLAVVTNKGPNNEADLTGAEFWVAWAIMTRHHADTIGTPPAVVEYTAIPQGQRIVPAVSLGDLPANSHSLAVGTPVVISWDYVVTTDALDPTVAGYYIVGGAAGLPRGQYQGMFYGDATQNQTGFVYPFLVELL